MAEPYCLAMVLCDAVHREKATGKFTILGTCNAFTAAKFPTKVEFCLYAAITDAIGPVKLMMRLVTSEYSLQGHDDGGLILEVESPTFCLESPSDVLESYLPIKAEISGAGHYHCELYANEHLLMARRLRVIKVPKPDDESEHVDVI